MHMKNEYKEVSFLVKQYGDELFKITLSECILCKALVIDREGHTLYHNLRFHREAIAIEVSVL